ncbi:OmpA family protein, partial [Pseudomonas quasicaspiana]|nr:OmpA family protein [Pseudomonas quasicaspiana]MDG6404525.1 OmpA family protein [Pseudomonas quasicaspiana]MDG6404526.1 OmpA family protein [Pseudomonas quasicaspiana]
NRARNRRVNIHLERIAPDERPAPVALNTAPAKI